MQQEIKYDDIVPYPDAVAKAIEKTGQPILLSLSPGNELDPEAIGYFRLANMLRVTQDVWDEQKYIDACFAASPLMMGGDLPACNQNGFMGSLVYEQDVVETGIVFEKGSASSGWIGVFNRTGTVRTLEMTKAVPGLDDVPVNRLRDIWKGGPVELGDPVEIEPDGVLSIALN